MLTIHHSNRLERLLHPLAHLLSNPLADPFASEIIIVQSQGMARWLSLQLAEIQGISANLTCPFPASFIWQFLFDIGCLSGEGHLQGSQSSEQRRAFEPEVMVWSIMESLVRLQEEPRFAEIKNYICREPSDLRLFQLSSRIAALLDQYSVHRPDWIECWSEGKRVQGLGVAQEWQARLWGDLVSKHGNGHRVGLLKKFKNDFPGQGLEKLPERLCLFGIPAMPKSQLDFFSYLANFTEVHIFLLSPCQHYWADLAGRKTILTEELRDNALDPAADLHYEAGCQILVSMGGMGRDFQDLLMSQAGYNEESYFFEPGPENILSLVQLDILNGLAVSDGNFQISEDDRSIQFHRTHGPMREVEILFDQLLRAFEMDKELEAKDILVMVPDIDNYAPLIEAVFAGNREEKVNIPFSIADRTSHGPFVKAFFDLLELLQSRFNASEVLNLLDQEPFRDFLGLKLNHVEKIRRWVRESGIRWGLNKSHRYDLSASLNEIGTWRHGLEQMMLGVIMPGDQPEIYDNYLPYGQIEGGDGNLLGRFLGFFSKLEEAAEVCETVKSVEDWCDYLSSLIGEFFNENGPDYREIQKIRGTLDNLAEFSSIADHKLKISLDVIIASLKNKLTSAGSFLCGRVTFCQMVPMRSIPFKMICLLGMNDNSFPRNDRPLGFDLMAGSKKAGDRSRRDDDRYLFLETMLSARQCLYVSYIGLNQHDNSEIPPSTLVSELLEHIRGRLGISQHECAQRFMVSHPLQPFSVRYFQDPLFTYSALNHELAANIGKNLDYPGIIGTEPPAERDLLHDESITASLDDFILFFEHPVRYLLRKRYGIFLDDYHQEDEDRELFSMDGLAKYQLANDLLLEDLKELGPENNFKYQQLRGKLPFGHAGRFYFNEGYDLAREMVENIDRMRGDEKILSVEVEASFGALRLTGYLNEVWRTGQFIHRPTFKKNFSHRDMVRTWIKHLLLNSVMDDMQTCFLCRDGGMRFEAFPEAKTELEILAEIFTAGQRTAMPIFPGASFEYAKARWGGKNEMEADLALSKAQAKWHNSDFYTSAESEDPYLAAAYGDFCPLNISGRFGFENLAEAVLKNAFKFIQTIKYS